MQLNRRNVLIGLGGIAAGSGALAGTGAFTSVTATRDATVNVAGDAGALLSIQAAGGSNSAEYVSTDASTGKVSIDLSSDDGGSGVNPDAVTEIDNLLTLTNQGSQSVGVWFADDSDAVTFRTSDTSIEGEENAVDLSPGNSVTVGLTVDTEGTGKGNGDSLLQTVTVHADREQPPAVNNQPQILTVAAGGSGDYTSIQNALAAAKTGEKPVSEIRVQDSSTYGPVDFTASGVTLRAASQESPTIQSTQGEYALRMAADGATVDGFQIDGTNGSGNQDAAVYFPPNVSNSQLLNNAITGPSGGLALKATGGQSNHLLENNNFEVASNVLQLVYINGATSVGNASTSVDFIGNTFSGTLAYGFGLEADDSVVRNNTFDVIVKSTTANNTRYATAEIWGDRVTVEDNDFTAELAEGGYEGELLINGNDSVVRNNTFQRVNSDPQRGNPTLFLNGGDGAVVEGNSLGEGPIAGDISGLAATIQNNTVENVIDQGIWLITDSSTSVTVEDNAVSNWDQNSSGSTQFKLTALPDMFNGQSFSSASALASQAFTDNGGIDEMEVPSGTTHQSS
jgi:hypothetical protein